MLIVAAIRAIPNAKERSNQQDRYPQEFNPDTPTAIKWRGIYAIKDLINRLRADIEDAAGITTLGMAEFAVHPLLRFGQCLLM